MIPNARGARLIQVIEVVTKEGEGLDRDDSPLVREVTRYYSPEGELLAVRDPIRVGPGVKWENWL